eukprot:gene53431-biopygen105819
MQCSLLGSGGPPSCRSSDGSDGWVAARVHGEAGPATGGDWNSRIECHVRSPCSHLSGATTSPVIASSPAAISIMRCDEPPTASPNLAASKTTAQSSDWNSGTSNKAVDGNADPSWGGDSCTHTTGYRGSTDPWWRVDLGAQHYLCTVRITNRGDCCEERLGGFEVRAGQTEGDGTANYNC